MLGATEMITALVEAKAIPDAERGFALTFAGRPFEEHDVRLVWQRRDPGSGDWYSGDVAGRREPDLDADAGDARTAIRGTAPLRAGAE